MKVAFVHGNFPAQFVHWAPALKARGHEVVAIGSPTARAMEGIPLGTYRAERGSTPGIFAPATRYEADCIRGMAAATAAASLKAGGFTPDLVIGHGGWGETLFLDEVWPDARHILYAELFLAPHGLDVGFDPEFGQPDLAEAARVRAKNAGMTAALLRAQAGLAPTAFQRDSFPPLLRERIAVIHDGVDTGAVRPGRDARVRLSGTEVVVAPGDEVVTCINRSLEPLRGLHVLLRALPAVLAERPRARVLIVGDAGGGYGAPPPEGRAWKDVFLEELGDRLDLSRVHFLGRVSRAAYLDVLAVSAAHVYLTYPFVLSWSLLEAMAAGCLVIASDTAPVREVVRDGENGRLVGFFDGAALSGVIVEALAAPESFTQMRRAARAHVVARYDLKSVCLPRLIALAETQNN